MLNVAVVEDNPDFMRQIVGYIEDYVKETGIDLSIREFSEANTLISRYRRVLDVILMDIEMPGMDGMTAAENVRKLDSDVVIVFITNMAQYAIKGYEVDALDFILKPINYQTFKTRFARALNRVRPRSRKRITLSSNNDMVSVYLDEIYYVESRNRYLHYHTINGTFSVRETMKHAEEELELYNFTRCNYWYLVNLEHVSSIHENTVRIGEYELEMSRRNKVAFREAFSRYLQTSK